MKTNRWIGLLLLGMTVAVPSGADRRDAGSSSGDALLRGDVGARPAALGGAFTSYASGPLALRYNPAGLARTDQTRLFLQHEESLLDIRREEAAASWAFWNGGIGVSISYLDYGSIDRTINEAVAVARGTADASDLLLRAGYGWDVNDALSVGFNLGYYHLELDDQTAPGFVADLGAMYRVPAVQGLTLGASFRNLGTQPKFTTASEDLPRTVQLGASWKASRLITAMADYEFIRDRDGAFRGGIEVTPLEALSLRVGYNQGIDADNGLTVGAGFKFSNIEIDYAYAPFGEFGDAHRVSAEVAFGTPKRREERAMSSAAPTTEASGANRPLRSVKTAPPAATVPPAMTSVASDEGQISMESASGMTIAPVSPVASPATPMPATAMSAPRRVAKPSAADLERMKSDAAAALDASDYETASELYERVLAHTSQDATAVYNLATAQYLSGAYSSAAENYRRVTELNAGDEEAWLFLGYSDFKVGRRSDAAESWRQVLRINPSNALARKALSANQG